MPPLYKHRSVGRSGIFPLETCGVSKSAEKSLTLSSDSLSGLTEKIGKQNVMSGVTG